MRPVVYSLLYLFFVLDHITILPHHGSDQSPWKPSLNSFNEFVFVDMRAGEHKEAHFLSLNVRKLKTFMYLKHFLDQVQKSNPSIPYKPIIHYNHERKQQ